MSASLAAYVLLGVAAFAQSALAGFDDYVEKGIAQWKIPGLALAVVKDGKVVHARGYGVRELGKPQKVDEGTLFAIGSTTKAMTAALVGMLVDEKKVAWDDPVSKHLPSFQVKDPYITRELTVRDLLTHRGGFGNADFLWYGSDHSTGEILKRLRLLDPAYSLRSRFIYQNVMYAAAGEVIAAVSGRPWPEVVKARIFDPLGMRDTVATLAGIPAGANVASPHAMVDGKVKVISNMSVDSVAAAGSVWSNVQDMSRWIAFLMGGGVLPDGSRLISETTMRELFRPQAFVPETMYPTTQLVKPHWMTYALGWFQQDYRGRAIDFHTGSIDGMIAIAGLIRDERLGLVVLANLSGGELRHALMYTVFDRYAGKTDRDWSAELLELYGQQRQRQEQARAEGKARRVSGTSPSRPLEQYVGTYSDPLRGAIEISLDGGVLKIRHGPGYVGRLEHWHYDTFRAVWDADWRGDRLMTFVLSPENGTPMAIEAADARFVKERPQRGGR